MRRRSLVPYLLTAGLFAFFAAFLLYPIWLTIASGFQSEGGGFTLYHILDVFKDDSTRRGLLNALGIAVATTALSFVIALPLAILLLSLASLFLASNAETRAEDDVRFSTFIADRASCGCLRAYACSTGLRAAFCQGAGWLDRSFSSGTRQSPR